MEAIERLRLRRLIEDLRAEQGSQTELVSLIIPPTRSLIDATRRIDSEIIEAQNIKSRTTRQGVHDALTGVATTLRQWHEIPKHGLAIYSSPSGIESVEPPEPFTNYTYLCGSKFVLEPLEEMLESTQRYALIAVDRGEFTLGILNGKRVTLLFDKESHVMSKHSKGGQSAHRYERQIEEATVNFYKRIAEMTNAALLPGIDKLAGVIVGGPGYSKQEVVDGEFLDYRIRKLIIRPLFDIGYTSDAGLRELVERASKTIEGMEVRKEKELLGRFMGSIKAGIAAYGEKQVREALEAGRVELLLLSDGTDPDAWVRPGVELAVVSNDTDEGKQFLRGFGGVGAILRW